MIDESKIEYVRYRIESDYDDFIQNDLQTVNDLIPAAESFIVEMERQIKTIIVK